MVFLLNEIRMAKVDSFPQNSARESPSHVDACTRACVCENMVERTCVVCYTVWALVRLSIKGRAASETFAMLSHSMFCQGFPGVMMVALVREGAYQCS